ncbi:FecR domain-containing protein [soil metagenome]
MNDDLLVKYLLGEASEAEGKTVQQWIQSAQANHRYYDQFKQVWEASRELAVTSTLDEHAAWQRFQTRIANGGKVKQAPVINRFSWMKIAASLLLLVSISAVLYFALNRQPAGKIIMAESGLQVITDTLPDGSQVTMNRNSSITYQNKFTDSIRAVALKGEAFFKVTPNKKQPFIVTVNNVQIRVVGTTFNIKSEKGSTTIVVETGVVQVINGAAITVLQAGEKLLLKAGDQLTNKELVSDQLYNYYRTHEFVCDETPLWKLVDVLNEAYNANIIIGRKGLGNLPITTTFNNESLDKILQIIHLTFDITISRRNGQIILQ